MAYCDGILLLMTNRPRNRRIAEEMYDAAASQLPDQDLDDKQDASRESFQLGVTGDSSEEFVFLAHKIELLSSELLA